MPVRPGITLICSSMRWCFHKSRYDWSPLLVIVRALLLLYNNTSTVCLWHLLWAHTYHSSYECLNIIFRTVLENCLNREWKVGFRGDVVESTSALPSENRYAIFMRYLQKKLMQSPCEILNFSTIFNDPICFFSIIDLLQPNELTFWWLRYLWLWDTAFYRQRTRSQSIWTGGILPIVR